MASNNCSGNSSPDSLKASARSSPEEINENYKFVEYAGPSEGTDPLDKLRSVSLRKRLTALIVDYNITGQSMLKVLLTTCGAVTYSVDTGYAAMELVIKGAAYDLIFVDKHLPILGGPETARHMHELGVTSKILGISGGIADHDEEEFEDVRVDGFLEKPFDVDKLIKVV